MTFAFTIRNQYVSSFATIQAAVENKAFLREYQHNFFKSAVFNNTKSGVSYYEFGDNFDKNRTKEFVKQLLTHKIDVYKKDDKRGLV